MGEVASFSVSASDADGDTLTYAVSPLRGGATFADRTLEWRAPRRFARDRPYVFTVSVDDGHGGDDSVKTLVTVLEAPNTASSCT